MIDKIKDRIKLYEGLLILNQKIEKETEKEKKENNHSITNNGIAIRLALLSETIRTYRNAIIDLEITLELAEKLEKK